MTKELTLSRKAYCLLVVLINILGFFVYTNSPIFRCIFSLSLLSSKLVLASCFVISVAAVAANFKSPETMNLVISVAFPLMFYNVLAASSYFTVAFQWLCLIVYITAMVLGILSVIASIKNNLQAATTFLCAFALVFTIFNIAFCVYVFLDGEEQYSDYDYSSSWSYDEFEENKAIFSRFDNRVWSSISDEDKRQAIECAILENKKYLGITEDLKFTVNSSEDDEYKKHAINISQEAFESDGIAVLELIFQDSYMEYMYETLNLYLQLSDDPRYKGSSTLMIFDVQRSIAEDYETIDSDYISQYIGYRCYVYSSTRMEQYFDFDDSEDLSSII